MEPTADFIHTKKVLDKTFCNEVIEWFDSIPHDKEFDPGKRDYHSINNCTQHEYFLDNFYSKIQKQLKSFSAEYHECYLDGLPSINEIVGWKMIKSSPEHIGFTLWHCERWPDIAVDKIPSETERRAVSRRHAVWMIYLNDVDGGCTDFKYQNISIQPEAGKLVIWPAYYTHIHRSNPDIRSDKYILTGWITT